LNALSSEQFIRFIERKLQEHGVKKVIPANDAYLTAAHKRAVILERMQRQVDKLFAEMEEQEIDVPDDLRQQLEKSLDGSAQSWDGALADLVPLESES
jgi:hypothetical protein